MSDKDVNKVHELAEHEDLKTFHYMLQGKDNGRIKLGSAADNADLIGETPEKKREKEFQDLLIKTAGMAALEEADTAISGMEENLQAMGESVFKMQQYTDRADYLKDQLYIISALLDHGSEEEKLLYLMEQGYSQEEIDEIKTDGTVNDHLKSMGQDMAIEAEDLRALIEAEAEAYTQSKEGYLTERAKAQKTLEKAEAEGNEEEAQQRREEIAILDEEFVAMEQQAGEAILTYQNIYTDDFDTVLVEFIKETPEKREYRDFAKNHLDEVNEQLSAQSLSLSESFNKRSNNEMESEIVNKEATIDENSLPVLNTEAPAF